MKNIFLICVIFFLLCGCVNPFAPALDESTQDNSSVLGDQKTVEGVLQNFKQSYSFKDTTIYGRLLANNFIFVYRDYDKGVDISWGRDDDLRTTFGLFQNADRLDLVWNNVIAQSGDSLKMTVTRNFNLTVTFNPTDVVRIEGYANLTLERLQATEFWHITQWRDESNF
jgi:hypothetical protein